MYSAVQKIMIMQPDADMYIHLGDGEFECDLLKIEYPDKNFFFLRGNCDFSSELNDHIILELENGHRLFAAHGHRYDVKSGTGKLLETAKKNECDIVLFGHSHCRYCGYEDDIHILNPGSCSCPRDGKGPSFAIIDIVESGISKHIVSL